MEGVVVVGEGATVKVPLSRIPNQQMLIYDPEGDKLRRQYSASVAGRFLSTMYDSDICLYIS